MPRQAPLTKHTEIRMQKVKSTAKPCNMCTKHFFWMPRQASLTKHTEIQMQKAKNTAKPCNMCTKLFFWMPRQAPLTKGTEIRVTKCKIMQHVHKAFFLDAQASSTYKTHRQLECKNAQKCAKQCKMCTNQKRKHFFRCPGKPHLQNTQKFKCKKQKTLQNHATCAQSIFFGCPGKPHLHNTQKFKCKKQKTLQNHATCAQSIFWMPRQAPLTKHTEIRVQKAKQNAKPCNMCTKLFFGCPGKLHLHNAQKFECRKHKHVQNHAKWANKT